MGCDVSLFARCSRAGVAGAHSRSSSSRPRSSSRHTQAEDQLGNSESRRRAVAHLSKSIVDEVEQLGAGDVRVGERHAVS